MLPYKHYIRKYNGTTYDYYTWVSGGILITGTKTELKAAPEGWEEYDISLDRSSVDLGVITTFTTPMTFHEDGASILRYENYTNGINQELELYIEKLDVTDYSYSDYLIADFDFTTFIDMDDGVKIMAREGGFFKKLTARENTVYTYDLEENTDVKWLKHDGILLQSRLTFNSNGNPDTDTFGESDIEYVLVNYITTEGTNYYTNMYDVDPLGNRYFMQNTFTSAISYTIRIKGTCLIDSIGTGFFAMGIEIRDGSNALVSRTNYFIDNISGTGNVYNFDHTEIISLSAGHRVCVVYGVTTTAGGLNGTLVNVIGYSTQNFYAYVTVDFTNRLETTYIPCLHISKVVELVCNSINDGVIPSSTSDLFDTMEIWLSSGDGVRGLEKSQITFTFSEIRDFLRSVFGAVFQFDGTTAIFSNIVDSFNKSLCYNLGEVKNVKVSNYLSELSINIKVGHTYTNTDSEGRDSATTITNGKDEYNTETHYITPLTQVKGDKNFISPYIASMYSIEQIRGNHIGKEFADSENDNEICVFHVDTTIGVYYNTVTGTNIDYQELYRKPINLTVGASFWRIYNVYSPESAYNIELSPARCTRRLGSWLRSLYQYSDADYMKYTASAKYNTGNQKMYTSEGATPLDIHEDWDIQIEDLCTSDQLLFKPFLIEVEFMESDDLVAAMKANKYGYIIFTKNGTQYKGYIMNTKVKNTFKGTGKISLLCTEDTAIDNLIR